MRLKSVMPIARQRSSCSGLLTTSRAKISPFRHRIAAAVVGTGVHAVMGTGGAPEGVLTAAAMRCLNGEIFARLVVNKPEHEQRCRAMGISDFRRIYTSKDLASGEGIIFAATGVTDGTLMRGVRFFGDGIRTSSIVMQSDPARIRFIDTIHVEQKRMVRIRF